MFCYHRNVKLRLVSQDKTLSHHNAALRDFVIIPVFCACMISAIGSSVGVRHAIIMPFEIEMDTEFISAKNAGYTLLPSLDLERNLI